MNRFFPFYDDDNDYNVNAPSFYDYLSRQQKLIEKLAKRIWEYDKVLAAKLDEINQTMTDYLNQWDANLEQFPENVETLLKEWLNDGTLDHIINETIFSWKLDADIFHDMFQTVKEFGAIGDGVTDDTAAIQKALDESDILFFPTGTYYFNQLNLTKSDTTLIFDKNVHLKSDDNSDNLDSGAFNITGETGETIDVTVTLEIGEINIPVERITPFKVGDLIRITQDRPTTHERDYTIHKQFYSQSLVTIRAIDPINNILAVNEPLEHRFFSNPKATLIKPINNIKIIGDNTTFDKMGTTTYANHFNIHYAKDFEISGFETFNGGGKGVSINRTFNYVIKDMTHHSPTNISAGHGYGLITRECAYGLIDNHRTYNSRHSVDIATMSYRTIVKNSYGFKSSFTTHGTNTQNLIFDNCHAFGSSFSIGNYSFWSDNDVKIINCSVFNAPDQTAVNIAAGTYNVMIDNIDIKNTLTGVAVLNSCDNILINNILMYNVGTGLQIRSKNVSCMGIKIFDFNTYGVLIFDNASQINFNDIQLYSEKNARCINLENCSEVTFNNLHIDGVYTRILYFNLNTSNIRILNSDIKSKTGARMFEFVPEQRELNLFISNTILNHPSIMLYTDTKKISGLKIIDCEVNRIIIVRGFYDIVILNTQINGELRLNKTAKKTFVSNNYGKGTINEAPTSSSNVVINNNILPIIPME